MKFLFTVVLLFTTFCFNASAQNEREPLKFSIVEMAKKLSLNDVPAFLTYIKGHGVSKLKQEEKVFRKGGGMDSATVYTPDPYNFSFGLSSITHYRKNGVEVKYNLDNHELLYLESELSKNYFHHQKSSDNSALVYTWGDVTVTIYEGSKYCFISKQKA